MPNLSILQDDGTYQEVSDDYPLPISGAGGVGAANVNVAQVATSGAAGTLAVARPTRRSLLVTNLDGAITVYIGPATVSAANGQRLLPGQSVPVTWVGLWQVIAASGTPIVGIIDEYD